MDIETILDEWKKDSKIDISRIATESAKTSELHEKYYRIYIGEKAALRKLDSAYKRLYQIKYAYYSGRMSAEECRERQFEPFQHTLNEKALSIYLSGDRQISRVLEVISEQKDKVEMLESILTTIAGRSYGLHNAVEFLKLSGGES